MDLRVLGKFESLFSGVKYQHRKSTLGDAVAAELYEDLVSLARSPKLVERVMTRTRVLNTQNRTTGIRSRRGDGSFGELVPGVAPIAVAASSVARGPIATIEIGTETKVLAKAMIKQIDRVINDLTTQVRHFRQSNPTAITIGLVGVNHAAAYTSFEGRRRFTTTGKSGHPHPAQEAPEAIKRLRTLAQPDFDHFLVLPFLATNQPPYPFAWTDADQVRREYAAMLVRVSRDYDARF